MTAIIRGISIEPEGVAIEYMRPGVDARANGVVANHTLYVPLGDQYDVEIDAVLQATQELLADVLEDLGDMAPLVVGPTSLHDDDDDDDDDDE